MAREQFVFQQTGSAKALVGTAFSAYGLNGKVVKASDLYIWVEYDIISSCKFYARKSKHLFGKVASSFLAFLISLFCLLLMVVYFLSY